MRGSLGSIDRKKTAVNSRPISSAQSPLHTLLELSIDGTVLGLVVTDVDHMWSRMPRWYRYVIDTSGEKERTALYQSLCVIVSWLWWQGVATGGLAESQVDENES